jgi:hypothetical protein
MEGSGRCAIGCTVAAFFWMEGAETMEGGLGPRCQDLQITNQEC